MLKKLNFVVVLLFMFASGNTLLSQWTAVYSSGVDNLDYPKMIAVDQMGFTYVAGTSFSAGMEANYLLIKYNPAGDTVWTRQYDGNTSGQDEVKSIVIDNDSDIIITGRSESTTGYDVVTIKYSSSGSLLWGARYNGLGSGSNDVFAASVDDSLNVYLAGKIQVTAGVSAFAALKYDKNGVLKWVKQFNGYGIGSNTPAAMQVNKTSGNIYVAGYVSTTNQGKDMAVLKYNRNGSLLWQKIINGVNNGDDAANAIVIDSVENVYVTGYVTTGSGNTDFITVKYGNSGDSLWTKYYSGSAGGADIPLAVTLDNQGNVFVTGESFVNTGQTSNEMLTVCYTSNGLEKWDSHYNKNSGCCNHIPVSIAADNGGNVLVGGISNGGNGFNDFVILKYNVANGIQTGIYRYSFAGSGNNDLKSMAVDAGGNCCLTGTVSFNGQLKIGTVKVLNSTIGIKNISDNTLPLKYSISNYPNPFNPTTKIKFSVPQVRLLFGGSSPHVVGGDLVQLKVYDISGREVQTLVNEKLNAGTYEITFDGSTLTSGIYFYRLISGDYLITKRMLLLK